MKAVILAAGFGTRLFPLTQETPKALVPIVDRPVLDIILNKMKKSGINEAGINLHYLSDKVKKYIENNTPLNMSFCLKEEPVILDTGAGLANFSSFINEQEDFIVYNCDIITDLDLNTLMDFHRREKATVTMVLVNNQKRNTVLADNHHNVLDINGQIGVPFSPCSKKYHGAGIFVYNKKIFDILPPPEKPYSIIPELIKLIKADKEQVKSFIIPSEIYWRDMGSITSYLQIHKDILLENKLTSIMETGGKRLWTAPDSIISPSFKWEGFLTAGSKSVIEDNCYLKNCIVWDNAVAAQGSVFENKVIHPKGVIG